jgi:hypothetical protein
MLKKVEAVSYGTSVSTVDPFTMTSTLGASEDA